jgi:hypothetical protein
MKNHRRLAVGAALIAGFVFLSFAPALAQQTAKACEEQWKSNKASIQASGKKKKDFMAECRGAGPTAAAPAKPAPTSTGSSMSAKACDEQWKANKPSIQASGKTKKIFVSECRTGSVTAAAPARPAPTPAAPPSEPRTTAPPTTAQPTTAQPTTAPTTAAKPTTAPTTAGTPAGANQHATEGAAKLRCPLDTVVWINLNSGVYHFPGKGDYGTTRRGAYMCEKDTGAAGFRAARNERHP